MVFKWMNQLQLCSWRLCLIGFVILGVAACMPSNEVVEGTVTREVAVVVETAVSPTPPASTTSTLTAETEPTLASTATITPTRLPITPQATPVPVHLITAEPVFTGGDLQFAGWSPNGRYLAYFEYTEEQVADSPVEGLRGTYPGTFVFYDTQTGEKCTDYPLGGFFAYEGGSSGSQWRWLSDGRLLISLPDGQLLLTEAPCAAGEDIAAQLAEPILSIGAASPDERWLVLTGVGQYWLFDWLTGNTHPIADVQPDSFNNVVWSPDSQHISITLAGNYTGDQSPIGGTRVIDVDTGDIVAWYDWEPANALDGTFGGPVWIRNDEFVVTLSLDQGPFFMNINGDVRPVLPLFDETFEPENYWPPVDVAAEVENGRYAILRGNEGRESQAKLYTFTPEGESIEVFEQTNLSYRLFPNGDVGYEVNGRYWMRPVFEADTPFAVQPPPFNPWQIAATNKLVANGSTNAISIFEQESGNLIERLQIQGYEVGFQLYPILSPDDQWLAIFVNEPKYSLGRALFVAPAPSK